MYSESALRASIEGWANKLFSIVQRIYTENLKKELSSGKGLITRLSNIQSVN